MGAGNDRDAVKIVHRAIEHGVNCEYSIAARRHYLPKCHSCMQSLVGHALPLNLDGGVARPRHSTAIWGRRV